jgi:hypothetical protein
MRPRLDRNAVSLLVGLHLSGCYSWARSTLRPDELVSAEQPETIRVTGADSARLVLKQPTTRNDSLIGVAADGAVTAVAGEEVCAVEVRRFSWQKTVGLGLGIAAGAAAAVGVTYLILLSSVGFE